MNIYFAGSIRGGRDDQQLYLEIIELLKTYGQVLTEHVGEATLSALGEDGPTDKYIYERDMKWLRKSDFLVAEVTTPSLGVGYELGEASGNMPVLCLYRSQKGKRLSAMIRGNDLFRVETYQTLADVAQILKQFFAHQKL